MILRCNDHQLLIDKRKKLHIFFFVKISAKSYIQFSGSYFLFNSRRMILPEIKHYIFILFHVQELPDLMWNIMPCKWKNITDIDFSTI